MRFIWQLIFRPEPERQGDFLETLGGSAVRPPTPELHLS
jgi:hypothetical protein